MSINNREEANKYYNQINNLVDDYIDKWKVKPSNLKRYLKPGSERFNRFLKRNNLDSIKGANVVLNDILDDRSSIEKDGVFSFESFKYFESADFKISSLKQCLYKGIDKATIKQEKIIADYFDINLGDIEAKDSDKHLFRIEDWQNDDWNLVIYSKEELDLIKENILEHLLDELSEREIEVIDGLKLCLGDVIDNSLFSSYFGNLLSDDKLNELVSTILGEDWSFECKTKDHCIWIS